ncbi:replication protein [Mycolicibacterium fortuitum]|jgi:phage replication O-like protein O|nr:replication protein [Mycolicibacterium fortuitum]
MASPQKENGYTALAHEILDEICQYEFNGAQLRIIMKIWRLTYGYKRKDHDFAVTFLCECTGLSDRTIKKEIKTLIDYNVLVETRRATRSNPRRLSFNKDYDSWTIKKSGDSMQEQLDLFESFEVNNTSPNSQLNEVNITSPHEVNDTSPNSDYEVNNSSPIKRNKDLKISIKDKEAMFEQFYSIYPRKIARKKVESSWRTLCKEKDFDPYRAIANTLNFIETCKLLKTDLKYLPYPATFLNQKRYEDYDVVDPEGLLQVTEMNIGGGGSALDRLLRKEMEGHGSERRDITDEVHRGGIPELPDGR